MNRKKLKYFGLILMLLALFTLTPYTVMANSGGGTGSGGSGHGGEEGTTKFDYWWETDYGMHYIKITAYKYSGKSGERPTRISNSAIFTNKSNNSLNGSTIYYAVNQPSDKLSYLDGRVGLNVQRRKVYMTYLAFPNLGSDSLKEWFLNNIIYAEDNDHIRTINNAIGLNEDMIKNAGGYYYLVESMGYARYGYAGGKQNQNKLHFLGTAYEMAAYNRKNTGSYPTIQTWVGTALYIPTTQAPDENGFVGKIFKQLDPYSQVTKRNCSGCSRLKYKELMNYNGYGLNIFWKEYKNFACNKSFNSHFPIDPNTHEVLPVVLNSYDKDDATIATQKDKEEGNAVNCCSALLIDEFGNDKDALCNERPECCYDCNPGKNKNEENPTTCTTTTFGYYQDAGDDKDTWYCMKSFDQYSQYKKKDIVYNGVNYARVVCRESLTTDFPKQLNKQQSVGTYMIWPTSSKLLTNNNQMTFNGTMTCKLSIDKAEIEAKGNANNIYQYIYNQVKLYVNNGEAESWYNLNPSSKISLTYNDDEYGGVRLNLVKDEVESKTKISEKNDSNWYKKLNNLIITINKKITYKLPDNAYNILTTTGKGSNNLSSMFNNINKNQFVNNQFNYGILPISYKAKPSRNISVNSVDYYKLTVNYSNIGDKGQFVLGEKDYTCPYEVTFAPPTNNEDNPAINLDEIPEDKKEYIHDDNNEGLENIDACYCDKKSSYNQMDLRGYLIKNSKMTCAQAQAIYCNSDRGNMNVEYRVISLTEPFPGSGETAKTMAQGGRDIGYNWRDSVDQTTSGGVVSTFILNNRRVKGYEVYNLEPLYVIELDSAKIKAIRDYNKTTTYADFNLTCVNDKDGTICTSPFLDQYVSSGTCHTAHTKDKFYKCADKDVPESEK